MPVPYQLKYSNMFHFVQDLFTYICDQLVLRFIGKTYIHPIVDSVIMGNIFIEVDKKCYIFYLDSYHRG